ncbi:hypothetical protein Syun_012083 [Stephania yunnanensis]|uniref:Uncharacterized protein n=1 Tax=Stephania yunnanensis TaxID=152371 RepID=A0AAP0K052_9MAGN
MRGSGGGTQSFSLGDTIERPVCLGVGLALADRSRSQFPLLTGQRAYLAFGLGNQGDQHALGVHMPVKEGAIPLPGYR